MSGPRKSPFANSTPPVRPERPPIEAVKTGFNTWAQSPTQAPVAPVRQSPLASPLSTPLAAPGVHNQSRAVAANVMPFKDSDIDTLGSDVQQAVMGVVKKVTEKMTVAKFGDLGDMLANVQLEADKLDPKNVSGGVGGWLKSKLFDVRKVMLKQMTTAGATFDMLGEKMASHVAVHETWVKDLEQLYQENFEQYGRILEVIKRGEHWYENGRQSLANMPMVDPADPEAPMKVQVRRDAESMLNRLSQRIDNFRRLKVLTECNGPRLRSQQDSSRDTARTLRDYSEQVIPIIKMEFAMYLQTQDVQNSGKLTGSARNLAETSLRRSADSAKDAMVSSAENANTAMISNDTMSHMRSRMLEAVTTVQSIETNAQQRRIADAAQMDKDQAQYLTQLQSNGATI